MTFVIDASTAAAWLLPDETNAQAESALTLLESEDALVPDLFWHEVRNILLVAERRKRISGENVLPLLMRLQSLSLATVADTDQLSIVRLAQKHGLSAYDAVYLTLAIAKNCPLATLDEKLARAAASESLPPMPD